MSTNIYLIGCSPANAAAVLCGSDLGGARKKVSPAKILEEDKASVERVKDSLLRTNTLSIVQFNV